MLVVALVEKHVLAIVDELRVSARSYARRRRRRPTMQRRRDAGFVRRGVIGGRRGRRERNVPRKPVRLYPVLEA
jgi:hypothetical protein